MRLVASIRRGDEHRAGGDVLGLVGGVLADIAFGEAELVGEDEGLAILAQRLPPVLVQRMDRHGEEAELHRDAPGGACPDLRARRRAPLEIISSLPADRDFQMPVLHHRPHIRQEGVGRRRGGSWTRSARASGSGSPTSRSTAAAPEASGRCPRRGLDHRQRRELEPDRRRCRAPCCRRRWASRCCPTCRTGPGTSTACGSASGASSRCWASASSRRPSRSTAPPAEVYPRGLRGGARRRLGVHGPRLRAAADAPGRRPARRRSPRPSRRSRTSPASRRAAGRARA